MAQECVGREPAIALDEHVVGEWSTSMKNPPAATAAVAPTSR